MSKLFFTPSFTLFYLACIVGIAVPVSMEIISAWWTLSLIPLYLVDMIGQVLRECPIVKEYKKDDFVS